MLKSYSSFINIFSRFSDSVAAVVAALISYGLRFSFTDFSLPQDYKFLILFTAIIVILVFPLFGIYNSWRGKGLLHQAKKIVLAWLAVAMSIIVILFVFKISADFSRLWLVWWFSLGLLIIGALRVAVYGYLHYQRKHGRNLRFVIVVGAGNLGRKIINQVSHSPTMGYEVRGLFDDDPNLLGVEIDGCKVIGAIADVDDYLEKHRIDEIWIALPFRAEERIKDLLHHVRFHTVNIKFIPDIFGFSLLNHSMTEIAGLSALNLSASPMDGGNNVVKRFEDLFFSFLILLLISPLMLMIAIGVKLSSSGPIFYKQERVSWNGKRFVMFKFRSMPVENKASDMVWGGATINKEVTKFGAFLRRTSLDELPQFINVLFGNMSIVGPRPERTKFVEKFKSEIPGYMQKHMVKAGITGWAQINGWRGDTCLLTRVEYDLYYIENWSMWFDLKIIFLTIFKGFINKNAY